MDELKNIKIMKNLLVVTLIFLWHLAASAQESGIQFHEDAKWTDLLAKAKSENKLIMLDAYAVWCGPCKWMDKNVFADANVAEFYNANFINAKFDMEKGEGLTLAKTYAVQAYPTILFIDGEGATMHRVVGGTEAEAFVEVGKTALDPDKRLAGLEKRFDAGERDPAFIQQVMTAFDASMHPRAAEVVGIYLQSQPDWTNPEILPLVIQNTKSTDSKEFKFLLNNRAAVEKELGKQAYLVTLAQVVLEEVFTAAVPGQRPSDEDITTALKAKLPQPLADQTASYVTMLLDREAGEQGQYPAKAISYYKKYPSEDFQELNEAAWYFYENVEDKNQLKEAVKWAQKSVQLNNLYFNNDTLAALYYKIGDRKNARKYAEKAIALAKAGDEDYTATEELLEKIKKMK
jgi:thioredoxin-related protein